MEPPRLPGAYDKNMFTFLLADRDLSTDSLKKRKLDTPDHGIVDCNPTTGYGFSGMSNTKPDSGLFHGEGHQNRVLALPQASSVSNIMGHSDTSRYGDPSNNAASWFPNKRVSGETMEFSSFGGQLQYTSDKDFLCSPRVSAGHAPKPSDCPMNSEYATFSGEVQSRSHINLLPIQMSSGVGQIQKQSIFSPVQVKVVASDSHDLASKNMEESPGLRQNINTQGAFTKGLDGKGFFEGSEASKTAPSLTGFHGIQLSRNSVNSSVDSLRPEPNKFLQDALRILAASSGSRLKDDHDGNNIQVFKDIGEKTNLISIASGQLTPHPVTMAALCKSVVLGSKSDIPDTNGKDGIGKTDEENNLGKEDLPLTDKLWDGTLQLSSSVVVSAMAFYKSGEKMQDFSWSESVEVKGKVRLEAFEKYVQDLPRSRTRGLMVMSFCCKEGSNNAGLNSMKEVAKKYREGKKVGFAQLSTGVDLYICPHSDAIITILAKHGFFKGIKAVEDKHNPLLGCVVWRKSSSAVTSKKTTELHTPQSGPLTTPSDSVVQHVATSDDVQRPSEGSKIAEVEKSIEFSRSPPANHPEHQTVCDNNVPPVSDKATQLSELSDKDMNKPVPSSTPLLTKQSAVSDGDDDLPEFDFPGAASRTSLSRQAQSAAPMHSGNPAMPRPLRDFHLEGQTVENLKQQSEVRISSMSAVQEKQRTAFTPNINPSNVQFHAYDPHSIGDQIQSCMVNVAVAAEPQNQNRDSAVSSKLPNFHIRQNVYVVHQPQSQIPNVPAEPWLQTRELKTSSCPSNFSLQGQVLYNAGSCPKIQHQQTMKVAHSKPKSIFDDDDMPEWCPPDFKKPRQEVAERQAPGRLTRGQLDHSVRKCESHGTDDRGNHDWSLSKQDKRDKSGPEINSYRDAENPYLNSGHQLTSSRLSAVPCKDYRPGLHLSPLPVAKQAHSMFMHEGSEVPPGFSQNPAFRPTSGPPGSSNVIYPSPWRGPRP